MVSLASILLFLLLSWPFFSAALLWLDNREGEERESHRRRFAISGLILGLLVFCVLLYIAVRDVPHPHMWLAASPLAAAAALILHAGLTAECQASSSDLRYSLQEETRPFLTTGFLVLAVFLADPIARIAMLLLASVLRVVMAGRSQGSSAKGWLVLRSSATGAILVMAGLLCPAAAASGLVTALGYCVLTGLFPVTASGGEISGSGNSDWPEVSRFCIAALFLAAALVVTPLSGKGDIVFRFVIGCAGGVTFLLAALEASAGKNRTEKLRSVVQASFALAALLLSVREPVAIILPLVLPGILLPFLSSRQAGKHPSLFPLLLVTTGMTLLILTWCIVPVAGIWTLILPAAALPAVRRLIRDVRWPVSVSRL